MARFAIVEETGAPGAVAEVLVDFRTKMGFPDSPNFIKAQAASTAVMNGTWGLVRNVLVEGALPRSLKEMIFVAISVHVEVLAVDEIVARSFVDDMFGPLRRDEQPSLSAAVADNVRLAVSGEVCSDGGVATFAFVDNMLLPAFLRKC